MSSTPSIFYQYLQSPNAVLTHSSDDALCNYLMIDRLEYGLSSKKATRSADVPDDPAAFTLIKDYLVEKGFLYTVLDNTTVFILKKKDSAFVEAMIDRQVAEPTKIAMRVIGEPSVVDEFKLFFETTFEKCGALVCTVTGIDETRGRLILDKVHLSAQDGYPAKQVFYPYLKQRLADYFDKFMASDESVLVLYGPPGTGKSTFLRSLITAKTQCSYVAYSKKVIESDALLEKYFSSNAQLLALEDIDNYMGKREGGNSLMAGFLNASEGIVKRKDKKIVFATNLPSIDKIDPALLRRGRCFDVIHFDLLTVDEARAVEVEMNLPEQDLSSKKRWALSEILNPVREDLQMHSRTAKSIGF